MLNAAELYGAPLLRTAAVGYIGANAHRLEPDAPKPLLELVRGLVMATDPSEVGLTNAVKGFVSGTTKPAANCDLEIHEMGIAADDNDLAKFGEVFHRMLELRRHHAQAQAEASTAPNAP